MINIIKTLLLAATLSIHDNVPSDCPSLHEVIKNHPIKIEGYNTCMHGFAGSLNAKCLETSMRSVHNQIHQLYIDKYIDLQCYENPFYNHDLFFSDDHYNMFAQDDYSYFPQNKE